VLAEPSWPAGAIRRKGSGHGQREHRFSGGNGRLDIGEQIQAIRLVGFGYRGGGLGGRHARLGRPGRLGTASDLLHEAPRDQLPGQKTRLAVKPLCPLPLRGLTDSKAEKTGENRPNCGKIACGIGKLRGRDFRC
jgi:hypothetical protein